MSRSLGSDAKAFHPVGCDDIPHLLTSDPTPRDDEPGVQSSKFGGALKCADK